MIKKDTFISDPNIDTMHLYWASEKPEKIFKCPIFEVSKVRRVSQDGRVGIIPIYKDEDGVVRVIVEQQYRHGSDSVTREFPAGLVEKDEDALTAAKRELLEETGLEAGRVTLLGNLSPNNAFMSNRQYFFLAEELSKVSGQSLDQNEEIDILSLPLEDVINEMGTNLSDNALMMAATGLLMKEERRRGGF